MRLRTSTKGVIRIGNFSIVFSRVFTLSPERTTNDALSAFIFFSNLSTITVLGGLSFILRCQSAIIKNVILPSLLNLKKVEGLVKQQLLVFSAPKSELKEVIPAKETNEEIPFIKDFLVVIVILVLNFDPIRSLCSRSDENSISNPYHDSQPYSLIMYLSTILSTTVDKLISLLITVDNFSLVKS